MARVFCEAWMNQRRPHGSKFKTSITSASWPASLTRSVSSRNLIDRHLGTHPQQCVSPGQAVKAMILNALGFVSAPLYLFEQFFVGKATEHLIGEGIEPEHLIKRRPTRAGAGQAV